MHAIIEVLDLSCASSSLRKTRIAVEAFYSSGRALLEFSVAQLQHCLGLLSCCLSPLPLVYLWCCWFPGLFPLLTVFSSPSSCFGGRRSGLMVSELNSGSSSPGSSPGREHCVVLLGKTLNSHSASVHPGV